MKPLGHKSYGQIPHLSGSRLGPSDKMANPGQEEIATKKVRDRHDLVIVQEKLDGSNCSVAKINGYLVALTRSGHLACESRFSLHHEFAKWMIANQDRFDAVIREGERLCGEWLYQAHGTKYRLPHEPFVAFDIFKGHTDRLTYHEFLLRVLPTGFTTPRLIHLGQSIPIYEVLKRLDPSGHGALEPVEGAVWRVERHGKVEFLAKYVRPDKIDGKYLDGPPVLNEVLASQAASA